MTEDNRSLWTACWELFTPAAAPVLRLLRQTFKKVARGPSPSNKGYCYTHRACVCVCVCTRKSVFACVSVKPEKSLLSRWLRVGCLFGQRVSPPCFLGTVRRCIAPSICTALAKQDETLEDKAVCASECARFSELQPWRMKCRDTTSAPTASQVNS